jgi:hypothetical protein
MAPTGPAALPPSRAPRLTSRETGSWATWAKAIAGAITIAATSTEAKRDFIVILQTMQHLTDGNDRNAPLFRFRDGELVLLPRRETNRPRGGAAMISISLVGEC